MIFPGIAHVTIMTHIECLLSGLCFYPLEATLRNITYCNSYQNQCVSFSSPETNPPLLASSVCKVDLPGPMAMEKHFPDFGSFPSCGGCPQLCHSALQALSLIPFH